MYLWKYTRWLFLLLLGFWCSSGCLLNEPGNQVQQPPFAASIPLKIWVVLAQGEEMEDEAGLPENRMNKGCRFTESEIRARVSVLQNNSCLYGPNLMFDWDNQLNLIPWSQLAFLPPGQRHRSTLQFYGEILLADEFHDEERINIYFCGWVTSGPNNPAFGVTFEPNSDGLKPHIIINDGAAWAEIGFIFAEPAQSISDYTPEHELGHYLGRFTNRCYPLPNGPRCYDLTEHSLGDEYNVMRSIPPSPLYLPGAFDEPDTEQGEVWDRIQTNQWNDP